MGEPTRILPGVATRAPGQSRSGGHFEKLERECVEKTMRPHCDKTVVPFNVTLSLGVVRYFFPAVIIIDDALKRIASAGRPIRVALIGAGFMGRGIALQIITVATGIRLAAIVARNLDSARRACREADTTWREVDTPGELQAAIEEGVPAITETRLYVAAILARLSETVRR